jgi:hypothetical protein
MDKKHNTPASVADEIRLQTVRETPQRRSTDRDSAPSPTEVLAIVLNFLRHYWDAPRQKSKLD